MLYIAGVDDVSAPATAFSVGIRVLVQLEQPGRSVLAVRQRAVRLRARLPSQVLLRMLHSLTAAHDDQPPTLPHQCIRMHTHDSSGKMRVRTQAVIGRVAYGPINPQWAGP